MRAIDVVKLMRSKGHKITIYKRPDGGIRVTGIDGIKFSSSNSEGINFLRESAKINISEKAYRQKRANEQVAREGKQRQKMKYPSLTIRKGDSKSVRQMKRRTKNALKRARKYRKTNMRQVSQRIRREGYERTIEALDNIARKESGLAYAKNVENLADFVLITLESAWRTAKGRELHLHLIHNSETFLDTAIGYCNEVLYDIQKIVRESEQGDGTMNMAQIDALIMQLSATIEDGIREGKKIYKDLYGK